MLVSLFTKYCGILWKHRSYQQHIIWLFLLILLSQQLQGSDGKPTKWNRSIQRRFMWKQMDSSVDGFVDRVLTGARVVKSMIGEFLPSKQSIANVADYLPTETTRIRYIIRNPHTKETKVIRVKPSKKVVKLMAMTPKPLLTDKPKPMHINEAEHGSEKLKHMHTTKESEYMTAEKFKSLYSMDPDKLRQLEKEQELIAEGRIPFKSETRPIYMSYRAEKPKTIDNNSYADDSIVSGKIYELNESWKPIYKVGDPPAGFTTHRPYMMSVLHTSIMDELLPVSQKQIYEPLITNDFPGEESKKSHTYEVTEYAAEESVVQPYTHEHDYYTPRSSTTFIFSHDGDSRDSIKHLPATTTEAPTIVTQIEDSAEPKTSHRTTYRSQREFLPTRETYVFDEETTTTTSAPPSTNSTTEEPNYPEEFLQKLRKRPNSTYTPKPKAHKHSKSPELASETSWLPSNVTYTSQRVRQIPYHQQLSTIHLPPRIKSQKWPPDVDELYSNSELVPTYVVSSTTEVPAVQEFTTQTTLNDSGSRKNVRLKNTHYSPFTETRHRSARHRGSVKYGDKLDIEER